MLDTSSYYCITTAVSQMTKTVFLIGSVSEYPVAGTIVYDVLYIMCLMLDSQVGNALYYILRLGFSFCVQESRLHNHIPIVCLFYLRDLKLIVFWTKTYSNSEIICNRCTRKTAFIKTTSAVVRIHYGNNNLLCRNNNIVVVTATG